MCVIIHRNYEKGVPNMTVVKENAYAKINLYLNVISRREDGFHNISTVMHSISLCDVVTVSCKPSEHTRIKLWVRGEQILPIDSKNLAYSAAMLYLNEAHIAADVTITLEKHIPISAGLAGGSSDAAAVLRALNKIFKRYFTQQKLLALAAQLGSDVPYCLLMGTCLCEGRGELITRLPDTLRLYTVIAIHNEHISTPWAYSRLDELFSNFDGTVPTDTDSAICTVLDAIKLSDCNRLRLYNIFEDAVLPTCSGARALRERMLDLGATHSLMSGSGPSVFGIFTDEDTAKSAVDALKAEGVRAFFAKSV